MGRVKRRKDDMNKMKEQVYCFFINFTIEHGFQPSVRDICSEFDFVSTQTAYRYLKMLEQEGKLRHTPRNSRCIEIVNFAKLSLTGGFFESDDNIPVIAPIIDKTQNEIPEEYIPGKGIILPQDLIGGKRDCFSVRVDDNCMEKVGICENDTIIFEKTTEIKDGDIVLVYLNHQAILRTYLYDKKTGLYCLKPECDDEEPIYLKSPQIMGRALAILKKL